VTNGQRVTTIVPEEQTRHAMAMRNLVVDWIRGNEMLSPESKDRTILLMTVDADSRESG
jgi:hypothetical protein